MMMIKYVAVNNTRSGSLVSPHQEYSTTKTGSVSLVKMPSVSSAQLTPMRRSLVNSRLASPTSHSRSRKVEKHKSVEAFGVKTVQNRIRNMAIDISQSYVSGVDKIDIHVKSR